MLHTGCHCGLNLCRDPADWGTLCVRLVPTWGELLAEISLCFAYQTLAGFVMNWRFLKEFPHLPKLLGCTRFHVLSVQSDLARHALTFYTLFLVQGSNFYISMERSQVRPDMESSNKGLWNQQQFNHEAKWWPVSWDLFEDFSDGYEV